MLLINRTGRSTVAERKQRLSDRYSFTNFQAYPLRVLFMNMEPKIQLEYSNRPKQNHLSLSLDVLGDILR